MCRQRINACILCWQPIDFVVPCDERTNESGLITLFRPTDCINKQTYTFTYHEDCMKKETNANRSIEEVIESGRIMMSDTIRCTRMTENQVISKSPSGNLVWRPEEFGTDSSV